MKTVKTITFSLPVEMSNDIEQMAAQEQRTVSELIREAIRQYRAQRAFKSLSKTSKTAVKKKRLTPEDFGGPFED
jgi:Arc/MetJ-type ribon-helix-helix transcriptional regulator